MKEIGSITAAFVDHQGLYLALARKLSTIFKRVLYWDPNESPFETVNEAMIGETFPEDDRLECCDDLWLRKKECDLFVFPDSNIKGVGMQLELESQGFPVWGPRRATYIEQSREMFIKILKDLGFEAPRYERIVGVSKLRDYLKDRENQIIKVSRFRGSMETFRWRSYDDDEAWLDMKAVQLGGVKNLIPFLVFESIDTPFEIGGDTYNVRGKFPDTILDGTEFKDRAYFGAVKKLSESPEQIQAVMEAFAPVLEKSNAASFWSVEVRVKGEHFYFLDPTPRVPLPASASQMEIYANLGEIIAAGAEGELVQPEPAAMFSAECALCIDCKGPQWPSVRIPEELSQWVKLAGACRVNGRDWFPPLKDDHDSEIGWLVSVGDTPEETIETLLAHAAKLPDGVTAKTEALADVIKEIEQAQNKGLEIGGEPMPEPESVIADL